MTLYDPSKENPGYQGLPNAPPPSKIGHPWPVEVN